MNVNDPRDALEDLIRSEIVGPQMQSTAKRRPLNVNKDGLTFASWDETRAEFYDADTEEEIIKTNPLSTYIVGRLNPLEKSEYANFNSIGEEDELSFRASSLLPESDETSEFLEGGDNRLSPTGGESESEVDDYSGFALAMTDDVSPSAMGLSFCLSVDGDVSLKLDIRFAVYESLEITVGDGARRRKQTWWVRRPVSLQGVIDRTMLEKSCCRIGLENKENTDPTASDAAEAWLYSRRTERDGKTVYVSTVALCNMSTTQGAKGTLFQAGFQVTLDGTSLFLPLTSDQLGALDDEGYQKKLLYRTAETYAVGHGAAGIWERHCSEPGWVAASVLPAFEVPDVSADVVVDEAPPGTWLHIDMKLLAEADPEGDRQVEHMLKEYRRWIERKEQECAELPLDTREAGAGNMRNCLKALRRMEEGWELVRTKNDVRKAFCLANRAMLLQQAHSRLPLRPAVGKSKLTFAESCREFKWDELSGEWRGFQMAFFLAVLPETVDPSHPSREVVDLIYFPTGGGKTEAYLLLGAFSILFRRLNNNEDDGTTIIMRYTLRLLTAQQFVRAATLICVLENMRSKEPHLLGAKEISIGIWVGSATTPNTQVAAVQVYNNLQKNKFSANKFLLTRCPWCGAEMGVRDGIGRKNLSLFGYWKRNKKIVLACADPKCPFSWAKRSLPIYVIDEDIYKKRPSWIIGTLDKFAMLAWRPEARSLFGLGENGKRICSPPSLIIQDELHLVSGPLGSMAGIYEPLLADLCTFHSDDGIVAPKIVAATATIRNFKRQVELLYGRKNSFIFPPPGLEENENFFAHKKRDSNGILTRGRRYLGIMAPNTSDEEVQTRLAAILLQGAADLPEENRDGYWTNLIFFSSLNELGNSVALLRSELPTALRSLFHRKGGNTRYLNRVLELTSRRRGDEVARAIDQLQTAYNSQRALDICLATSMVEVGIDVDRLGLMTIIGQPKTTAQYIQVSGRVGRSTGVSPGLVIVLYKPYRPRDRSYYEHFQSYHEHLYSQVEPNSLTPFSTPVLEKALHAVIIAYIRMRYFGLRPDEVSDEIYESAVNLLRERANAMDPLSLKELARVAQKRRREWKQFAPSRWGMLDRNTPGRALMRFPGIFADENLSKSSWVVPASLRSVDAECKLGMFTSSAASSEKSRPVFGSLRRSHAISPFGVGSIVTTPDGLSVLVRGIDEWFGADDPSLNVEEFRIHDSRLADLLEVSEFRNPPDYRARSRRKEDSPAENTNLTIPVVRFPTWLYCPICGHLEKKKATLLDKVRCPLHQKWRPLMIQVPVFLMCEYGHLDDFPFDEWLHADLERHCDSNLRFLPVHNNAPGQYRVECETCGKKRLLKRSSTGGVYVSALHVREEGVHDGERLGICSGSTPWLRREGAACGAVVKMAFLGEINAYFPVVESALHLSEVVCPAERPGASLRTGRTWTEQSEWRYEEFKEVRDVHDQGILLSHDPGVSTRLREYIGRVRAVDSLTETRVLRGFTRVGRKGISLDDGKGLISSAGQVKDVSWLPASQAVGEGIYFELDPTMLHKWENDIRVVQRMQDLADVSGSCLDSDVMNPRFVLLHTLNHLLISRLIFECGYGSVSLRERIFSSTGSNTMMAGSLIYASSSDSEGTLGGLVRMSEPAEFEKILYNALKDGMWCSSDPVCMELGNQGQGSGASNLAACYSCAFVPEPSCERGNRYLDRGLVIGTLEHPEVGYFSNLVRSK